VSLPPVITPSPLVPKVTLGEEIVKDIWVHVGGLVAIGIGCFDLFYAGEKLGLTTDLILVIGGLAAQGVKIVNGSAAAAATAAAGAIANIASVVAAQQAIASQAAAAKVVATAAVTAAALPSTVPAPVNPTPAAPVTPIGGGSSGT
jgi:hypothetical protein